MELMLMLGCFVLDLGVCLELFEVFLFFIIEFLVRFEVFLFFFLRLCVFIVFSSISSFFAFVARYSSVSMNVDIVIGFMMVCLYVECGKFFIFEDLDMIKM